MKFGKEEKARAKKLLATTVQVVTTVIANGMRMLPGSILLVIALDLHFEPEMFAPNKLSQIHLVFAASAILWQGVTMSFSLAIFDAGARTFLKRNSRNIQL